MADLDLVIADSSLRNPRSTLGISLLSIALAILSTAVAVGQERAAVERVTVPIKVLRYAQRLVSKYDTDGDGDLSAAESSLMNGTPEQADENRDGLISVQEMAQHVARYGYGRQIRLKPAIAEYLIRFSSSLDAGDAPQDKSLIRSALPKPAATAGETENKSGAGYKRFSVAPSRIPAGLPKWFIDSDHDGDLQLSLSEYAPQATAEERKKFAEYDSNRDGLVTAWELLGIPVMPRPR